MVVKKRVIWYLFSFILLLSISIITLLISRGYYFDFIDNTFKKYGSIYVKSIPRNSHIYLNDIEKKKKTPFNVPMPPGSYLLKISKEGYHPFVKNVVIREGFVTREDYIFLIKEKKEGTQITQGGIKDYLVSHQGNKLIYLDLENNIWLVNLQNNNQQKIFSGLDNKISLIQWDQREDKFLISSENNDNFDFYILNNKTQLKIKKPAGLLKKAELSRENNQQIIALIDNTVYKLSQNQPEILKDKVTTFAQEDNAVFYTEKTEKNYLINKTGFDFKNNNKLLELDEPVLKIIPSKKDYQVFIQENGELYFLDNNSTKKIHPKANEAQWTKDERKLLYKSDNELRVYVAKSDNPFFRENFTINRFSKPITGFGWFYDYSNLTYQNGNKIYFSDISGSYTVTLTDQARLNDRFKTDKYGRNLIFAKQEKELINIYLLSIGEETGLIPY